MGRVVRGLRAVPPGAVPSDALFRQLSAAWQNEGYSADIDYLKEIARQAGQTPGPILECGTGLTTLVLATVAARRGVEVWSLEQDPAWASRVTRTLGAAAPRELSVACAPLVSYGEYAWYSPPADRMPQKFVLVVCDGPTEDAPGGRYGLLPVMRSRLARGAIILLDDADRRSELAVLRRWQDEYRVLVEVRRTASRAFAVITCP